MNDKLNTYIIQQKSLKINDEEIKKQLLNSGWSEKEIDSALNPTLDRVKEKNYTKLLISLLFVGVLLLLGLAINIFLALPYNAFKIDPSIELKNDTLLIEIENQEKALHDILHSDLLKGQIPISKELAVLFRMTDLLHLQNDLLEISDQIDSIQQFNFSKYILTDRNTMVSKMKNTQETISQELNDKTHDGTIDPTWFIHP